jgi:hypothetical protein
MNDTLLGLPINRVVTFIKPLFNLFAGGVAAWLVAKVNILGILGIGQDEIQNQVATGLAFLVTTGLLQLADLKWIKGHHIELENEAIQVVANPDDEDPDALLPDAEVQDLGGLEIDTDIPPDEGDAGRPHVPPEGSGTVG